MGALLVACGERSRVDPEAQIDVVGSVRTPDGGALVGGPVRMGAGVSTGDGVLAVLTLGLSCASGACTGPVFDTTTDDTGSFAFTIEGRDTQSSFGAAVSQLVSVSAAPTGDDVSGAAASARFRIQTTTVRLPPLDLVDPGLVVDADGGAVTALWSTPAPGPYELRFETADPVPVWTVVAPGPPTAIDARVLEDTAGRAVLTGASTTAIEGSDVALGWRSPGVAYTSGAGVPASRGRDCTFVDAGGVVGAETGSCALTDGELSVAAAAPPICAGDPSTTTTACSAPEAVLIDLDSPVPAELVVVRGCDGGCTVDVSADGRTYRPAGAVADEFGAAVLDGQAIVSVRVGLGSTPGGSLREVSVWGPTTGPALVAAEAGISQRLRSQFTLDDGDGRRPVAPVVTAVAVLAAAVLGLGYVVGRRHRPGAFPSATR